MLNRNLKGTDYVGNNLPEILGYLSTMEQGFLFDHLQAQDFQLLVS